MDWLLLLTISERIKEVKNKPFQRNLYLKESRYDPESKGEVFGNLRGSSVATFAPKHR